MYIVRVWYGGLSFDVDFGFHGFLGCSTSGHFVTESEWHKTYNTGRNRAPKHSQWNVLRSSFRRLAGSVDLTRWLAVPVASSDSVGNKILHKCREHLTGVWCALLTLSPSLSLSSTSSSAYRHGAIYKLLGTL